MRSIELFAGAGGLALGTSAAGFGHEAVIELDEDACATISENQRRGTHPAAEWPEVIPTNVRDVDFTKFKPGLDLLSGGVPCQPWSLGGKHKGFRDDRNLFPDMVKAIRSLQPKAVLIENVKGLQRSSFANYFEYIKLQIKFPEIAQRPDERWPEHHKRLEREETSGGRAGLRYNLVAELLNAADFGVPQRRERVFIVAFRSDLGVSWSFPEATHSRDSLLYSQFVSGEYWDRHGISKRRRPAPPDRFAARVARLRSSLLPPSERSWITVRDALVGLPDPTQVEPEDVLNHRHNPGARSYPGHTGSPLDEPAKTLKAGVHGVPGGENTLAFDDGSVRYFTVREAARLQTFPDEFVFHASWTESMRQIGNAVPVKLAEIVASNIAHKIREAARGEAASA